MELKTYFAQDAQGSVMPGAICMVYEAGTETLVTGLLDQNDAPLDNPFAADDKGKIQFAAPNGRYDLRVVLGARDYSIRLQCLDVEEQVAAAQSAADTAATEAAAAESARDAAAVNGKIYADTTAGLASGDPYFSVPSADSAEHLILYKNNAGAALEVKRYPATIAVSAVEKRAADARKDRDRRSLDRDGVLGYSFPVLSHDGKVAGFKSDGGVSGAYVAVPGNASTPTRDAPGLLPVLRSEVDGRIGIGFDPYTGETFALLDSRSIAHIAAAIGASGALPLSAVRGDYAVSVVRMVEGFTIALAQDRGGQTYDVKQRADGAYDTLVIDRKAAMDFSPFYGQSNAGQGGTAGVAESRKLWPHTALSFDGRFQMQGNNGLVDGASLTDLVPLFDTTGATVGQYPATMSAFSWSRLQCDNGIPQAGIIAATAWEGSQPAWSFLPGTTNYSNLITFATRAKALASAYGRSIRCRWLTYIQGENGANWAADFSSMADQVPPALKALFGQTEDCRIALWQIVGAAPDNGVGALQIAAAARADVELVGPMYQFPIFDTLHLTAIGRMMQGDVHAEFLLQQELGRAWTPLVITSAVRAGATVTLTVALPPGTRAVSRDADWVPAVPQDGFVFRDDGGDTAITGISYSGSTITLTLASTPSGANPRVRYAMDNGPAVAGWYPMAGNVVAMTESVSPSFRLGHATPRYIRHNLVRQQIGVS